jgi:hypothetical protein
MMDDTSGVWVDVTVPISGTENRHDVDACKEPCVRTLILDGILKGYKYWRSYFYHDGNYTVKFERCSCILAICVGFRLLYKFPERPL